ncbi:MAG: hypothetical protein GX803_04765 [Lentisphaerae bacterium]|jgi:hypothetical protein|nr:hypothetical protein [Lentisphaerota bacterium]
MENFLEIFPRYGNFLSTLWKNWPLFSTPWKTFWRFFHAMESFAAAALAKARSLARHSPCAIDLAFAMRPTRWTLALHSAIPRHGKPIICTTLERIEQWLRRF